MMKITFYLFFILATSVSFAQNYQPMLVEGNYWDTGYYDQESICATQPQKRYVLGSDIDVNGTTYKQIEIHNITGVGNYPCYDAPFVVESNYTISNKYIRENIAEKKVYIWGDLSDNGVYQEYLLYDFNLEVGDTMTNPYSDEGNWTVTNININNGIKTYELNTGAYNYTEGVGGSAGIISQLITQFEYYDELVCYGNYNTTNNCEAVASINDDFIINDINVYPNPTKDNIRLNATTKIEYQIFTMDGKIILEGSANNIINTSMLNNGVYFLKLKNNTSSSTKKIIINK